MLIPTVETKYGKCILKPVTCLDKDKLFIKADINVIASLAGTGKTTFLHNKSEEWRKEGYEIVHFNFDSAPCYDKEMYNVPVNEEEYEDFFSTLRQDSEPSTIIIIDSFKMMASFMNKDTDNNADVLNIINSLKAIVTKTQCTIILVHHVYKNKQLKSAEQHFYGARALEEQCSSGFIFNRTGSKMTAQIVKSRSGLSRDAVIEIT